MGSKSTCSPCRTKAVVVRLAASGFVHRAFPGWARAARMESFFMLLAICCLRLHGADSTNMIEFAKSLPKRGSVQWEVNQQLNQQRQEVYRKRVAIPDATSPFVPRDAKADLIRSEERRVGKEGRSRGALNP